MNAMDRADKTLARAQARSAEVVTPDSATSPMDHTNTVQIPRTLVDAVDEARNDPEATQVLPAAPGAAQPFGPSGR